MDAFIAAALRYIDLGFGVLPVDGKRGFLKGGWKAAAHTKADAEALFAAHPGKNIALVLPADMCVIDIDPRNGGDETLMQWEDDFGPLPETVMSRTGGGGKHLYFRCDPKRKLKHSMGRGVDIIGSRGQVTEEPSVTTEPYLWTTRPGDLEYPWIPAECYEPERPKPRMNGHGAIGPADDATRKYCYTVLANEKHRLATAPKGGRNAALNNSALALGHFAHYGTYGEDEARIALRNACLDNGLIGDDGEPSFITTFNSGWAKGLSDPTIIEPARPMVNGHAREEPRPAEARAPSPEKAPAGGKRGADLDFEEFEPLEWLIEGVLPVGATIVAGKAKIGKSWLVLDMGLAVASGTHCFGKIQARKADVLYLALEDGWRRLHSRQRKLIGTAPAPAGIDYWVEWPAVDEGLFANLASYLDENTATRLVIVDTFGKVRGNPTGRKGVFQQDYADLGAFQQFAAARKIALVIVHHVRKQGADDVMDQISGSTATQAAVDTLIVLTRKRGQTGGILSISGKDIEEEGEYAVDFDKTTGRWQWLGEAGQVKRDSEQQKVYDYLAAQTEPQGPSMIAEELAMPLATVKSALQRLKKAKTVDNPSKGIWTIAGRLILTPEDLNHA